MGGRRVIIAADGGQAFCQGGIGEGSHIIDIVDKSIVQNIVLR
jgi:hypothetical protein